MSGFSAIALAVLLLLSAGAPVAAQDQEDNVPLGDLARTFRKEKPADVQQQVIDNDNLPVMMDKAEAERLDGKPVFSIDPSGKTFRMTSPDGTCSLSFDAKAAALISKPYVASDLPQDELVKLEAEAAIQDGVLQVTLRNGTDWELKEIVVGFTVLNAAGADLHTAQLLPATDLQPRLKLPDTTTLYHLKATGPPASVTVFRAAVNDDLGQLKDWHWSLVSARGVPPAAPIAPVIQEGTPLVPIASPTSQSLTSPVPLATPQTTVPAAPLTHAGTGSGERSASQPPLGQAPALAPVTPQR